jgi:hypothetical protein
VASCGTCTAPQSCGGAGTANVCGLNAPPCTTAYAQGDCLNFQPNSRVSSRGHNWRCADGNCANCAGYAACAPGASGCPWGPVWADEGVCD